MPPQTAPYHFNGNLLHYPERIYHQGHFTEPEWKPNIPFAAKLYLDSMCRGRSAAYFMWQNEQGIKFPMFMSDMLNVIQKSIIENGWVDGIWQVIKKGQNYGIQLTVTPVV